ncbi:hypothetical protein LWI28_021117 [Acer negundo]|uniref:Uncharacterized protein n=1 Tax=Acer negundo TaxID=4023 RepID=A0AAD5J7F5_ACENE|nr:hypothetical protein LWI28_021117 [Acer negundo]
MGPTAGYHYVLSDSEEGSGQLVDVEHVSVSANPPIRKTNLEERLGSRISLASSSLCVTRAFSRNGSDFTVTRWSDYGQNQWAALYPE